ncbi:uncharacterized protein LOC126988306 [Eriocheir sinensis]|uniref:uncharacterized protein LOC126988306 n=1 Tax=Eriocheir sinensis TaxID=95602 RepID=UPI0021CAAF32|nr:uncharacterized protein LOC126988306 [Eriocheir sinensis]
MWTSRWAVLCCLLCLAASSSATTSPSPTTTTTSSCSWQDLHEEEFQEMPRQITVRAKDGQDGNMVVTLVQKDSKKDNKMTILSSSPHTLDLFCEQLCGFSLHPDEDHQSTFFSIRRGAPNFTVKAHGNMEWSAEACTETTTLPTTTTTDVTSTTSTASSCSWHDLHEEEFTPMPHQLAVRAKDGRGGNMTVTLVQKDKTTSSYTMTIPPSSPHILDLSCKTDISCAFELSLDEGNTYMQYLVMSGPEKFIVEGHGNIEWSAEACTEVTTLPTTKTTTASSCSWEDLHEEEFTAMPHRITVRAKHGQGGNMTVTLVLQDSTEDKEITIPSSGPHTLDLLCRENHFKCGFKLHPDEDDQSKSFLLREGVQNFTVEGDGNMEWSEPCTETSLESSTVPLTTLLGDNHGVLDGGIDDSDEGLELWVLVLIAAGVVAIVTAICVLIWWKVCRANRYKLVRTASEREAARIRRSMSGRSCETNLT